MVNDLAYKVFISYLAEVVRAKLSSLLRAWFDTKVVEESPGKRLLTHVSSMPAGGPLPANTELYVFEDGRLVNVHRDVVPARRAPKEQWWLVPAGDVSLDVSLQLDHKTIESEVSIRFEPEMELWTLVEGREFLTAEDLNSLVTSQLSGQMDMLGHADAAAVAKLTESDYERLRARLSLLLQSRSLRCTGLGRFRIGDTPPRIEQEPPPAEEKRGTGEITTEKPASSTAPGATRMVDTAPPEPPFEYARREAGTVEKRADHVPAEPVDEQIGDVLASFEECGCRIDEPVARELESLAVEVASQGSDGKQIAERLRRLADAARTQETVSGSDLRRARGLDFRLGTPASAAEPEVAKTHGSDQSSAPLVRFRRRPGTWWLFGSRSVDERLGKFLRETLGELRTVLDEYRGQQRAVPQLVALRRVDQRMQLAQELLETVPTLSPPHSELRLHRSRVKELLRCVEGAVSAVETAQAEARAMQQQTPGSQEWTSSCDGLCAALDYLIEQLRGRRAVR